MGKITETALALQLECFFYNCVSTEVRNCALKGVSCPFKILRCTLVYGILDCANTSWIIVEKNPNQFDEEILIIAHSGKGGLSVKLRCGHVTISQF